MNVSPWKVRSFGTRFASGTASPILVFVVRVRRFLHVHGVFHTPKFTHARDYTDDPPKLVSAVSRRLRGAQVRQHGFHDVRSGRSREYRHVGDRHRRVATRPATEPKLPVTSRGDSCRMPIASTRPG